MKIEWIILLSLLLSFGAAVGVNLQKLSMNKEEQNVLRGQRDSQRSPFLQPFWCLGTTLIVIDAVGDFFFIGMAPQSLLAPLGALSLGWNLILAPIFHTSESCTCNIVFSTAIIYVGTIVTVLFASVATPIYNLDNLLDFARTQQFVIYFFVCLAFLLSVFLHANQIGYGMVHFCSLAGCFGGLTLLCAKCSSELLKNVLLTGIYSDWTTSPVPYIFVLGMLGTVMIQMKYLNMGLAKFEALIVVPVYQTFWTAFSITGGMVFFQEYREMTNSDILYYSLGILISFCGVCLLVTQRKRNIENSASESFEREASERLLASGENLAANGVL